MASLSRQTKFHGPGSPVAVHEILTVLGRDSGCTPLSVRRWRPRRRRIVDAAQEAGRRSQPLIGVLVIPSLTPGVSFDEPHSLGVLFETQQFGYAEDSVVSEVL